MKTRRSVDARMLLRLIIWVLQTWRTMQCFSLVMDDKNDGGRLIRLQMHLH